MINGPSQDGNPQGSAQEQSPRSAPTISLPKGGGAIRGIGEKFAANPVTGTGSMTVPIATSPAAPASDRNFALLRLRRWQRAIWLRLESVASIHHAQDRQGLTQNTRTLTNQMFSFFPARKISSRFFKQDADGEWVHDHGKLVIQRPSHC